MSIIEAAREAQAEITKHAGHALFLEGRIRFYAAVLRGEWPFKVDLQECIEEDVRAIEERRAK